jgi:hypothetical protein
MRPAQRSEAGRSPGWFGLVPTCPRKTVRFEPRWDRPWYARRAGAVGGFAGANPPVAPAGSGWYRRAHGKPCGSSRAGIGLGTRVGPGLWAASLARIRP